MGFMDEHFTVIHVGWYDVTEDTLTSVPPNIILGEN